MSHQKEHLFFSLKRAWIGSIVFAENKTNKPTPGAAAWGGVEWVGVGMGWVMLVKGGGVGGVGDAG